MPKTWTKRFAKVLYHGALQSLIAPFIVFNWDMSKNSSVVHDSTFSCRTKNIIIIIIIIITTTTTTTTTITTVTAIL